MTKLIDQLQRDYPQFKFVPSNRARWSAGEQTIYYTHDKVQTLHEIGHALLGHEHFGQDIELLKMERAAWNEARQIAPNYNIAITDDDVETALDSYRDWLHSRSKCPKCGQTGIQSRQTLYYYCPTCSNRWVASDGRSKALRRHSIKTKK